jgi:CheY-like chemotaxis protein
VVILYVEDNVDGAESMAMILGAAGHEVHIAFNGPDGLAAAEDYRPDAILLDIGLPGLNGYDVAKTIRRRRGDSLTILAITGYCQPADRERSRLAGIDQHLVKFLATVKRGREHADHPRV